MSILAALAVGAAAPGAVADTLSRKRQKQAQVHKQQAATKSAINRSRNDVADATDRLEQSRSELGQAQAALASIRVDLDIAKNHYSEMVEALARAEKELAAAKREVAKGEANLAAQLRLIGQVAREAYQQRNPLEGLAVVIGSSSSAELEQRIQWSTTIFDATAAEKARLDEIQIELEKARDRMVALEAQARRDRDAAAEQLAVVRRLEQQAESQAAAVADLVVKNEQLQAAAREALAADEAMYRKLEREDARLTKEIKAEVARQKRIEEEKRRKAEAARRAEEEARKKKAATQAASQEVASSSTSSSGSESNSGSNSNSGNTKVSSYGFIRPIAANPGSPFGLRYHPILHYWRMHNGTDFGARTGTPIYAARAGTVLRAERAGGFGNFVLIGHGSIINGKYTTTGYAHQSKIVVKKGQKVQQGQLIGYVGNTGLSTTPHLHLEVRLDGTPVNAMNYIP